MKASVRQVSLMNLRCYRLLGKLFHHYENRFCQRAYFALLKYDTESRTSSVYARFAQFRKMSVCMGACEMPVCRPRIRNPPFMFILLKKGRVLMLCVWLFRNTRTAASKNHRQFSKIKLPSKL